MVVTQDYRNFKQLLEYFVAHLEYCHFDLVTRNGQDLRSEKSSGYDKYIKPFIDKGIFAKKGKYIDERIKDWIYYDNIKLGLEIKTTSGKYQSNGYFINCGRINIQANWTGNRITDLYVTKYINHNNYEQLYAPVSIQELGLFDEQEPNKNLVNFYTTYFNCINEEEKMNNSTSNSNNNFVEEVKNLLLQTKNLILTGAPGTGKTYLAKQIADELTDWDKNDEANKGKTNPYVSMVQFHPSYDYTDFVEGLRPIDNGNGEIGFERKDGEFKKFCKEAISKKVEKYVFIIDEINRGEISKIFGELFYAIDPGYRGEVGRINTQYQNLSDSEDDFSKGFYVPENVYIIGTMNDIDRSVDSFDFAMRRRFAWKEITPTDTQDSMLSTQEEAINRMNSLNKAISEMPELGTQYQLGASYFMKIKEYGYNYADLWNFHIKGLLYEYLRGVPGADSKLADLKKAYEPENEQ